MLGLENLLKGKTLTERYRIDEVIGRGETGPVFRALDQRLGIEVALKAITSAVHSTDALPRFRAALRTAFEAASQVHHPNAVAVYDCGTDPLLSLDFVVMELLRGEGLGARLNTRGKPPVPLAQRMLLETAQALAALHRAGSVHGDVRPGNLFLTRSEDGKQVRVRVLPFGIAALARQVGGTAPVPAAAPSYLAPEYLTAGAAITPAADAFGFGATAFHLLTGKAPFTGAQILAAAAGQPLAVSAAHAVNAEISPDMSALLARALQCDPAERHADANALLEALETVTPNARGAAPRPMAVPVQKIVTQAPEAPPAPAAVEGLAAPEASAQRVDSDAAATPSGAAEAEPARPQGTETPRRKPEPPTPVWVDPLDAAAAAKSARKAPAPKAAAPPKPAAQPKPVEPAAAPAPAPPVVAAAPIQETPAVPVALEAQAAEPIAVAAGRERRMSFGAQQQQQNRMVQLAAAAAVGVVMLGGIGWMAMRTPDAGATSPAAPVARQFAAATPAPQTGAPTAAAPANTAAPAPTQSEAAQPAAEGAAATDAAAEKARKAQEQRKAAEDARLKEQQLAERKAAEEARLRQQQLAEQQAAQLAAQQRAAQQAAAAAPVARPVTAPVRAAEAPRATASPPVVEERPVLANSRELQRAVARYYPALLRDQGVSGRATVQFRVLEDGRVDPSSITAIDASRSAFGDAAVRAIRTARYRPARANGRPVPTTVTQTVTWNAEAQ